MYMTNLEIVVAHILFTKHLGKAQSKNNIQKSGNKAKAYQIIGIIKIAII